MPGPNREVLLLTSLLTLLLLPAAHGGDVSPLRWATLFINTMRASLHTDNAIYNFDAVVDDLTFVLQEYMVESRVSENVEKPDILGECYLCQGDGTMRDLRSLEKIGTIRYRREVDYSVTIHIVYRLRVFYMRLMGLKKKGSAEFHFRKNQLVIDVRVAHVSRWWSGHARCIFSVTQFGFTQLGDVRVKLETKGLTHGELTSQAVTGAFHNSSKFLLKAIETKILQDMYKKLQRGNRFICTDPGLDQVAVQLHALTMVTFTKEYDRRCGKDRPAPGARRGLHFWRRHHRDNSEEQRDENFEEIGTVWNNEHVEY